MKIYMHRKTKKTKKPKTLHPWKSSRRQLIFTSVGIFYLSSISSIRHCFCLFPVRSGIFSVLFLHAPLENINAVLPLPLSLPRKTFCVLLQVPFPAPPYGTAHFPHLNQQEKLFYTPAPLRRAWCWRWHCPCCFCLCRHLHYPAFYSATALYMV